MTEEILGSEGLVAMMGIIEGLSAIIGIMFFIIFIIFIFISIVLYIYLSIVYKAIAKKANLSSPNLALIPGFGPLIIAFQASKMHWWPWLLLIGGLIPFVNLLAGLAFFVFFLIWHWKMFEAIKKPGWWALLLIIPIVNLVIIGVAAWSKD